MKITVRKQICPCSAWPHLQQVWTVTDRAGRVVACSSSWAWALAAAVERAATTSNPAPGIRCSTTKVSN